MRSIAWDAVESSFGVRRLFYGTKVSKLDPICSLGYLIPGPNTSDGKVGMYAAMALSKAAEYGEVVPIDGRRCFLILGTWSARATIAKRLKPRGAQFHTVRGYERFREVESLIL